MNAVQTANTANASAVLSGETLKNIDTASKPTVIRPRVARAVLVNSLVNAAGSFKQAINSEIAVCLAIFAQDKGVNVGSKKELYAVYKEAGYDCSVGGKGKDYKTVNRRINYAGQFYNSLKKGTVENFMGDETTDAVALASIVNHLTVEYNFRSMNDVLAAAGVSTKRAARKTTSNATTTVPAPAPQKPELPEADKKVVEAAQARVDAGKAPLKGQAKVLEKHSLTLTMTPEPGQGPSAADEAVMAAMAKEGAAQVQRRLEDGDKWVKLQFEGATVIVPKDMKPEALGDLGIKLMGLANHMKDKLDVKALEDAFKQAETH